MKALDGGTGAWLCGAAALLPAAGRADEQPVTIAPFAMLDDASPRAGKGAIAYRVAFEAKHAKARFGLAGGKRQRDCSIVLHRGLKAQEIPVDCPDAEADPEARALVASLPAAVDLAGEVCGRFGLTSNEFLGGSWRVSADTPLGHYEDDGELGTPGVQVALEGMPSILPSKGGDRVAANPPMLAFALDRARVAGLAPEGMPLDLSAYPVVAPREPRQSLCDTGTGKCSYAPLTASSAMLRMRLFWDVGPYVEQEWTP